MITNDLYENVLIQPVKEGANELFIVSGYATAAMTFHHFQSIKNLDTNIRINLIVGMAPQDGLSFSNHCAFKKLVEEDFVESFECSYIVKNPPVHSKVYIWLLNNNPFKGFSGSANYTQKAFGKHQRETLNEINADDAFHYYESLISDTIYCNNPAAEDLVNIFDRNYYARRKREIENLDEYQDKVSSQIHGLDFIKISFLDRNNTLPTRSGLNWGQRPENNREPNQAYIRLPANIYNTDFFPDRTQHFTVYTDDEKILICTRAQDNGKAIHTPHNNSLIGEYFRNRLGLPNGSLVKIEDLELYGRTDVVFYKIDEETYFMDFSSPNDG